MFIPVPPVLISLLHHVPFPALHPLYLTMFHCLPLIPSLYPSSPHLSTSTCSLPTSHPLALISSSLYLTMFLSHISFPSPSTSPCSISCPSSPNLSTSPCSLFHPSSPHLTTSPCSLPSHSYPHATASPCFLPCHASPYPTTSPCFLPCHSSPPPLPHQVPFPDPHPITSILQHDPSPPLIP